MDVGAIERLSERVQRSRAQEATIAKETAERDSPREQTAEGPHQPATERTRPRERVIDDFLDPRPRRPHDRSDHDDLVPASQRDQAQQDRVQSDAREHVTEHQQEAQNAPVNIQDASPADIQTWTYGTPATSSSPTQPSCMTSRPTPVSRRTSCSADGRPTSKSASSPPSTPTAKPTSA